MKNLVVSEIMAPSQIHKSSHSTLCSLKALWFVYIIALYCFNEDVNRLWHRTCGYELSAVEIDVFRETALELCLPSATDSHVVDGMAMVDDHHLGLLTCFRHLVLINLF